MVQHRQAAHLDVRHVRGDLFDLLIQETYFTPGVMTSFTLAFTPLPCASPRTTMSQSVIMPTNRSSSLTGNAPTSSSAMRFAAAPTLSQALITTTSRLIRS